MSFLLFIQSISPFLSYLKKCGQYTLIDVKHSNVNDCLLTNIQFMHTNLQVYEELTMP